MHKMEFASVEIQPYQMMGVRLPHCHDSRCHSVARKPFLHATASTHMYAYMHAMTY